MDRLLPSLNIEGSATSLPTEGEKELATIAGDGRVPAGTHVGRDD
jgi:hypothetical protein